VDANWLCTDDSFDFVASGIVKPAEPSEAAWHRVLDVQAGASSDEIKLAYRKAMMSYHSDKVASLGPKLRALAEEESRRINIAYDEARKLKGFR
jgi:DnaJ-domain-containing protein 1